MPISADVALDQFRTLAREIGNRKQANEQLAVELWKWVEQNFEQQGLLTGTPWQELSPETIAQRLAKSRGSKGVRALARGMFRQGALSAEVFEETGMGLFMILQDTGAMRQSFDWFADNDQAGVGSVSSHEHADLTAIHQYGDPTRNIPARPMLPDREQALELAVAVYDWHIQNARDKAGL